MNQLRISHDSIDMDDIISDLNPGSQAQSQQVMQADQHSEIPSFRTQ